MFCLTIIVLNGVAYIMTDVVYRNLIIASIFIFFYIECSLFLHFVLSYANGFMLISIREASMFSAFYSCI